MVPGVALAAVALLGLGCTGQVGEGGPAGSSPPGGSPSTPGGKPSTGGGNGGNQPGGGNGPTTGTVPPAPMPGPDGVVDSAGPYALRRLTRLEYQNTLRDLLGVTISDDDKRGFAVDSVVSGGFASGAAIVTSVDSRQLLDVSSKLADGGDGRPGQADAGRLRRPGGERRAGLHHQVAAGVRPAGVPAAADRHGDQRPDRAVHQASQRRGRRALGRGGARRAAGDVAVAASSCTAGSWWASRSRTAT